jgi:hypothetical protein
MHSLTSFQNASNLPDMAPNNADKYRDQTLLVEGLIGSHPDFHPNRSEDYTDEERQIFAETFLIQDWDQYDDDYRVAYQKLRFGAPARFRLAQRLFIRFCEKHGIQGGDLEIDLA